MYLFVFRVIYIYRYVYLFVSRVIHMYLEQEDTNPLTVYLEYKLYLILTICISKCM